MHKWYTANREKKQADNRKWYAANRAKRIEDQCIKRNAVNLEKRRQATGPD